MGPKICFILPLLYHKIFDDLVTAEVNSLKSPDVEFGLKFLRKGPCSIESEYDEALAVPFVIESAIEAEKEGFDAVIIDCMGDPGLETVRTVVKIPVVGPCQSAIKIASSLGRKFTIVTVLSSVLSILDSLLERNAPRNSFSRTRYVNVPVLELETRYDEVVQGLKKESLAAIKEDGSDTIILGCTGMIGMTESLMKELGIPVIDPTAASLYTAELLCKMKLSHSKVAYPTPDMSKPRVLP